MELNLHLDEYGRTIGTPRPEGQASEANHNIDYTTRCLVMSPFNEHICDALIQDCQVTTSSDLPLTFWLGAEDEPRCLLEELAKDIFMYHVRNLNAVSVDMNSCGCEWWVQVRPSTNLKRINSQSQEAKLGIQFHWDKDETLRDATGFFVHPHLSTVTYLTDYGAPTMVFEDSAPDEHLLAKTINEACISWPRQGKHLVFDGRFLHGAPSNLLAEDEASAVRVTFLVNIWLYHKPLGVEPIPPIVLNHITDRKMVKFNVDTKSDLDLKVEVSNTSHPLLDEYSWQLGEEVSICTKLPIDIIRKVGLEKHRGGSVLLHWDSDTSTNISTNSDE